MTTKHEPADQRTLLVELLLELAEVDPAGFAELREEIEALAAKGARQ